MKKLLSYLLLFAVAVAGCKHAAKKQEPAPVFSAKEAVLFSQLVYKPSIHDSFTKYAPDYQLVFVPHPVNGNYAIIVNKKNTAQYALVIRGSMIEFTNDGFQNFILQDFNIFTMKKWQYADSVKDAYIGQGTSIGFGNLLQLKDTATGLGIKDFIEQKLPDQASIIITGHSLGGNLAYPMAGYLKKELKDNKKNNLQLITFGAPAAGNADFVQDMDEKFPAAERYVIDRDIAPMFPDLDKVEELSSLLGIDSALSLGSLKINGVTSKASDILNIAGKILNETDIIPEGNKYVQSVKHLRLLKGDALGAAPAAGSADAMFERAYKFHKVDAYAVLLGGRAIN